MDAAAAVTEILERSGETKASLSRKSGVSRALIDEYLKGVRQPTVAQLARLGEAVGLRLHIGWTGEAATDIRPTPRWARPSSDMEARPTTRAERAQILMLVDGIASSLPKRRPDGDLQYPPFRTLRKASDE